MNSSSLAKRPVAVFNKVVLGGVKVSTRVPEAKFNPQLLTEVQFKSNVPTQIRLIDLPKQQSTKLVIVSSSGKKVELGSLKTTSSGTLAIPPITLLNPKNIVTIKIQSGKKSYKFVVRTTS